MNPYAKNLGERDAMTVLIEVPDRLEALASQIGPAGMARSYEEGKWNLARILSHLLHIELMFGTRFRQALTQDDLVVQPFDQDRWIEREPVSDGRTELQALLALRRWNLALWQLLTPTDLERTFLHPELGRMTIQDLLDLLAGHDLNHLSQVERIATHSSGSNN